MPRLFSGALHCQTRQLQNLAKAAASSMPPYQNCTYFRETGRAVSMKPPMPRQVLQLPQVSSLVNASCAPCNPKMTFNAKSAKALTPSSQRPCAIGRSPRYSAVPFFGTKNRLMSTCSVFSSAIFLSMPPAYPVRLPLVPTTR